MLLNAKIKSRVLKNCDLILRSFLIFSLLPMYSLDSSIAQERRFDDYEIRVIRPRYFAKRKRFELGSQFTIITNQTFIYTYMVSGLATFHFNEFFAIEGSFSYGASIDKDDQRILDNDFGIKTQIIRTQSMLDAAVLWTPIYGKYQLASGRLIYFDTFLLAGVGQNSVDYRFDHCDAPADETAAANYQEKPDTVVSYSGFSFGGGQRYFISKKTSIRWDLRGRIFNYPFADGECFTETPTEGSTNHTNVTVQIGMSYFL